MSISGTARQTDLLRFIAGYQQAHGFCPSINEMLAGVGTSSHANINQLLSGLAERRLVRTAKNQHRAIEVLVPVAIPRAPDGAPLYFIPAPQVQP